METLPRNNIRTLCVIFVGLTSYRYILCTLLLLKIAEHMRMSHSLDLSDRVSWHSHLIQLTRTNPLYSTFFSKTGLFSSFHKPTQTTLHWFVEIIDFIEKSCTNDVMNLIRTNEMSLFSIAFLVGSDQWCSSVLSCRKVCLSVVLLLLLSRQHAFGGSWSGGSGRSVWSQKWEDLCVTYNLIM